MFGHKKRQQALKEKRAQEAKEQMAQKEAQDHEALLERYNKAREYDTRVANGENPVFVEQEVYGTVQEEEVSEPVVKEETQAEETPAAEPVEEQPVEETPAEEPVEEQPVEETQAEEPVEEETQAEEPVEEETPAEEAVEEQPEEASQDQISVHQPFFNLDDEDEDEDEDEEDEETPVEETKEEKPEVSEEEKAEEKELVKNAAPKKKAAPKKQTAPKQAPAKKTAKKEKEDNKEDKETVKAAAKKEAPKKEATKKAPAKKAAAKKEEEPEEKVLVEAAKTDKTGAKYEIFKDSEGFKYRLVASNGQVMANSEVYTTLKGAQSGIETLKSNLDTIVTHIDTDKHKKSQVIFCTTQNKLLIHSATYSSKAAAESAIESIKGIAPATKIVQVKEDTEAKPEMVDRTKFLKEAGKGKFVLVFNQATLTYQFALKASNGQTIVTSKFYKSDVACKGAISKFREEVKTGTFYTVQDKNGHYQFRLYSSANRLVQSGIAYDSKAKCLSNIESICRFIDSDLVE